MSGHSRPFRPGPVPPTAAPQDRFQSRLFAAPVQAKRNANAPVSPLRPMAYTIFSPTVQPESVDKEALPAGANRSQHVRQLNILQQSVNAAAPVQRKIYLDAEEYPTTWKGIARNHDKNMQDAAQEIWNEVVGSLSETPDTKKLEQIWNKIAKDENKYDISNEKGRNALIAAINSSYSRSMRSRKGYEDRSNEAKDLAGPLLEANKDFRFVPSARNPMVNSNALEKVDFSQLGASPEQRIATHTSTMLLEQYPTGLEFQGALRKDGAGMHLSSNLNSVNDSIVGQLKGAEDLKNMAANLLASYGIEDMSRKDAMQKRVIRHTMKLYLRISEFLARDAPITVPEKVAADLDGIHAEIRIEQDDDYDVSTHHVPSGTKLPCMGCFLYFNGQKIKIGHWHGPCWVTNTAISQQILEYLKKNITIGKLGPERVKATGKRLREDYEKLPKNSKMAHGKTKNGSYTTEHNPDSDSELDEKDFGDVRDRALARAQGEPNSPLPWMDMEEWPERNGLNHEEEHEKGNDASVSEHEEDYEEGAEVSASEHEEDNQALK